MVLAAASPAGPFLTQAAEAIQRLQSERLWYVLITIIVLSLGWVVGRELVGRLGGRADGSMPSERMGLPSFFIPKSRWGTTEIEREDLDYARDAEAALHAAPPRTAGRFLLVCLALFASFVIWAYLAQIDEVARGAGRVIPSSKQQVVQSLEGGIVKEISVHEGDKVEKGQTLLLIDKTGFSSDLGEIEAKVLALQGAVTRLQTEASNPDASEVKFPEELRTQAPSVVSSEQALFSIRRSNLINQLSVLNDRLIQKRQELAELDESRKRFQNSLQIAQEERAMKAPLAASGIVPKTDILKLDREIVDYQGQLATTNQSIPRIQAAIREAEGLVQDQKLTFRQTAQSELTTKLADLEVARQSMTAAKDRVVRTDLRSPVDGFVNKLHVNTVGGVVRPGDPLVEITPMEDTLMVEARIQPRDIAFIRPDQKALVKLTAYDFSIYGGLEGKVAVVSSDSIVDEANKETYYTVTVKTDESVLRKGDKSLPIIPGMVASVDIMTGKKSVLDYLLKPILKARYEALRER
jgi:adhesin transport system membrane fusion protein